MCAFTTEMKDTERFILYSSLRYALGEATFVAQIPFFVAYQYPYSVTQRTTVVKNISMQMLWCFVNAFN